MKFYTLGFNRLISNCYIPFSIENLSENIVIGGRPIDRGGAFTHKSMYVCLG